MEKARFLMERDNATESDVLLEDVESAPHLDGESADNGNENEFALKGLDVLQWSKSSSRPCIDWSKAAREGQISDIRELLFRCPQSLTHTIPTTGKTPLHLAVRHGHCHVVRLLVENCYQHVINTKFANFRKQLHSLGFLMMQTLKLLREDSPSNSGLVEVNTKNDGGVTALDILDDLPEQEEEVHMKMKEILTRAGALRGKDIVEHKPDNRINHEVHIELGNKWYNKRLPQQTTWSGFPTSRYYGLLLAATLLATMTFHAALRSPVLTPKNLSNEFPIEKQDAEIYHLFILFNSIAFFTSVALITLLTYQLPLKPWLLIIVFSAIGAYMCTIMAISPHEVVNVLFIGSFISLAAFFKCLALDKIAADYIQWMCTRIQLI